MSESPTAPDWFTKAISAPCESRFANVDGTPIHYLAWNLADRDKPGLLFAHGFRAHAQWWSFIAPFFLSRFRVVSLDFSGMGDSGAREKYTNETFSRDIVGVLADAGFQRATLVGHSFGGGRVLRVCAEYPEVVERAVVIDSIFPVPELDRRPPRLEVRTKRIYPTYEAARARFRLVPEQNAAAPYIIDFIAHHSLKQTPDGWTWKFDEGFTPRQLDVDPDTAVAILGRIPTPVTFMYGDLSRIVSRSFAHILVKYLRFGRGPIAIPQSHHHVMLDQPLALVAALKATLY